MIVATLSPDLKFGDKIVAHRSGDGPLRQFVVNPGEPLREITADGVVAVPAAGPDQDTFQVAPGFFIAWPI